MSIFDSYNTGANNIRSFMSGYDGMGSFINQAEGLGGDAGAYTQAANSPDMLRQAQAGWGGMSGLQKMGTVANTAMGFFNAYNSFKAAKDQRKYMQEQSAVARANLNNSVRLTNASLADRQKARLDANPNNMSVSDYMNKYGASA